MINLSANEGIHYFDGAEAYSEGRSETQLGEAIKKLSPEMRQKIVIGSKILPAGATTVEDTIKHCDDSLARLGMTCIDLYMIHWPVMIEGKPDTAATFKALKELQSAGKIKHIGVSNFGPVQLTEALTHGVKIAVN